MRGYAKTRGLAHLPPHLSAFFQPFETNPPTPLLFFQKNFIIKDMENYNINCELNSPRTWENIPPETKTDFWQYSEIYCQYENPEIELIENASTGTEFYLKKNVSYGDFLIITFLMIFLVFGILKFLINFLIPKLMNFKR